MLIQPLKQPFTKTINVLGDKSIFHRAAILASLCDGESIISNTPISGDAFSTLRCLTNLGVECKLGDSICKINGKMVSSMRSASSVIDAGNSATTMRLLSGILPFIGSTITISGDHYLQKRPMKRIIEPLELMGAKVEHEGFTAPLKFYCSRLHPFKYRIKPASSQVKSMLLFAGMLINGTSEIEEPEPLRDHLENLFSISGINFHKNGNKIQISGVQTPSAFSIELPGDISSAAYFIAAAAICKDSSITIKRVGINKQRIGFLRILEKMGGNIEYKNIDELYAGERICDLKVTYAPLHGIDIDENDSIPSFIDEIPILSVIATTASGVTNIHGASELKVKESDRIHAISEGLKNMGGNIEPLPDGLRIVGGSLHGGSCDSYGDHRIAMSLAIAALCADSEVNIQDIDSVGISYPNFIQDLNSLRE